MTTTFPLRLVTVGAAVALGLALGACNSDDSGSASGGTTTTDGTVESSATAPPPCEPVGVGVLRNDKGNWILAVTAPDGTERTKELAVEDRSAQVSLRGGFDLDGDGTDEVFLTVGTGASTTVYALASIAGCEPTLIGFDGDNAAMFPVGSTVGNQNGLRCRPGELGVYSSTSDGETFEWTLTTYALEVATLTETAKVNGTYPADDPNVPVLGSLDCPGVTEI